MIRQKLDMRVMTPRFPQTDREVKRHPTHLSPVSLTAPSPFGRNLVAVSASFQSQPIQGFCMRQSRARPAILRYLLAAALGLGLVGSGHAADRSVFVIAAGEGYGVDDCLAEGGECGRAVADAWCEAHGRSGAISFGPAVDEVTGAIPRAADHSAASPYVVKCRD
jgi:hypothetical protein